MNKKYLFLFVLTIIVIILIILFGLKQCDPRVKDAEDENLASSYRDNFINANINFTCQLYKNPQMIEDKSEAELKNEIYNTYEEYNLPVNDNPLMVEILKIYENDKFVISTVKSNSLPCAEGGQGIFLE
jgi:hypothetical protein